ncbi:MAG: TolC family protein [Chitinophagales bacterium]|nr:TolC family protein [Chitinophagales bacterium]
MKNKILIYLSFLFGISHSTSFAQEQLDAASAVQQALENNFGVLISANNVEIANNNKSILNSRFLPSLSANAGANYNLNNIIANRQDGTSTSLNGANSSAYNASLNLSYTLFDGLGRWYNYKQLKEQYALSELQARATIENAVVQTLAAYYDVAVQSLNSKIYKEALLLSANRLERTRTAFNFGQGNMLAVLNAEVDLSNDSISYANANLAVANAKRNLNAIMVQDINSDFTIDTNLVFMQEMDKNKLYNSMLANNASLLQAQKNMEIASYNVNVQKARYLPSITGTAQYGWNRSNNNAASFLASSVSYGLSAGATASWNLFDGGATSTAVQNTKLNQLNLNLELEQTKNNLNRDFENAWADYQNKVFTYKNLENNLQSTIDNFSRSNEKFKLGQINSVEYRQAQQNLLLAATQLTQSKYSTKLAEIQLLQLAGLLLDTGF